MIEAHGLVKRYGSTMAVNDLSFSIRPGLVTGFLGPNGAGKTTTMRMILGLDAPTQGSVTVGGRSYRDLPAPMREVGALLDAKALLGGRRARDHLSSTGSGPDVIEITGMDSAEVGRLAAAHGIALSELIPVRASLEEAHGTDPGERGVPGGRGDPMTDAVITLTGPDHRAAFRAATFGDVLRSEWTKLRSVRSTFWALTVTVVLGVGLGAVISAATAHAYPGIAQALPDSWRNPVTEFWPTEAGGQLASVHHSAHTLQPWPGFGVMCLFVAIVYAIAWTLLDRRDA